MQNIHYEREVHMNFWDIEAFMAIVETRNLAKAAELLFLSQSTVSRRLMNLEEELGHSLARRSKGQRSIHLTERGEQFIPVAERWLSVWNETQRYKESPSTMHLTIGCTEWFNSFALRPFYSELMRREPTLSIKVVSAPSHLTYSKLNELEIDAGFVCNAQVYKGIDTIPVFRDPLVLVCSEGEEWVSPDPISPERLDPAYEIEWNHLPDYRMWHNRWWNTGGEPRIVCDFSVSLCFSFIQNSKFWIMVPKSVAEHFVGREPRLIIQPLTDSPPDFICYMIVPHLIRASRQRGIELFQDCLHDFVEDLVEKQPIHKY